MDSLYTHLIQNPPKLNVVANAREVVVDLISVMCDNKAKITFKKNADGDFKIFCHRDAYSNFQIKHDIDELEWAADSGNWRKVFRMINTGTVVVHKIKSRGGEDHTNVPQKIKNQIEENPLVINFLRDACIDDLLSVHKVLKLLRADEGGLSLDDYRKIQSIVDELE